MQKVLIQLNEKFTAVSDKISETAGRWWVTFIFCVFILIWAALGPVYDYSDTWQLVVNTSTTIITSILCLLTLSASNRTEKRNWELHQNMMKILQTVETLVEKEEEEINELKERNG